MAMGIRVAPSGSGLALAPEIELREDGQHILTMNDSTDRTATGTERMPEGTIAIALTGIATGTTGPSGIHTGATGPAGIVTSPVTQLRSAFPHLCEEIDIRREANGEDDGAAQ